MKKKKEIIPQPDPTESHAQSEDLEKFIKRKKIQNKVLKGLIDQLEKSKKTSN